MRIAIVIHTVIILAILSVGFAPLLGVMWVGAVAEANGCQVDEGSVHSCIVDGRDMGQTLYTVGVMGWLMLVTIPLGLGAAGLYVVVVTAYYLIKRGRGKH